MAPRSFRQDPLQQLGEKLGFERLVKLTDRNLYNSEFRDYPVQETKGPKLFPIGSKVMRLRHKKSNKLQSNFEPELFTVIAVYKNNTYKLCDSQGRILKRNVNHSNLRRYFTRTDSARNPGGGGGR